MKRLFLARFLVLALLAACGRAPDGAVAPGSPRPEASGGTLGTFSLKDLDGKEVGFQPGQTGLTLIEVWAPEWFEGSDEQFRRLQEIHERYGNRGLRVLCVAFETDLEEVGRAIERHNALFDVGLAHERALEVLDPQALPTTWLADREGRILKRLEGYQPLESLEPALEEALGTP